MRGVRGLVFFQPLGGTVMPDGVSDPVPVIAPVRTGRRTVWLLGLGVAVGLLLGVLLTLGAVATYATVAPPAPLPSVRESVQVFHELNELRQQVNRLNEANQLKDREKDEAVRRALDAVAAAARPPAPEMPARRAGDPFAELDAEIERLEQTQKVLNTILDLFAPKAEERKPSPAPPPD